MFADQQPVAMRNDPDLLLTQQPEAKAAGCRPLAVIIHGNCRDLAAADRSLGLSGSAGSPSIHSVPR